MVWEPAQIAPSPSAGIEVMTFRKTPSIFEGICEFFLEIVGKPPRNPSIVIENLTNLRLNCRMIKDIPTYRPTALRNSSKVMNSAVPASISASRRASSMSSGPKDAPRRLASRCAAKPACSYSESWSTSDNTSVNVFMGLFSTIFGIISIFIATSRPGTRYRERPSASD
jgi:hypothetical protein